MRGTKDNDDSRAYILSLSTRKQKKWLKQHQLRIDKRMTQPEITNSFQVDKSVTAQRRAGNEAKRRRMDDVEVGEARADLTQARLEDVGMTPAERQGEKPSARDMRGKDARDEEPQGTVRARKARRRPALGARPWLTHRASEWAAAVRRRSLCYI